MGDGYEKGASAQRNAALVPFWFGCHVVNPEESASLGYLEAEPESK